jgi:hypothetical protein
VGRFWALFWRGPGPGRPPADSRGKAKSSAWIKKY